MKSLLNYTINYILLAMPSDSHQGQLDIYEQVKKHLIKFSKPRNYLAWKSLAGSFAFQLLAILLIRSGHELLGWTLHMLNTIRFFIQFHDMAHLSFFQGPQLNKIVGAMIGIYVQYPFDAWRDGHNHHHRHFGNLERLDLSQTILFTKKQYDEMKYPKKLLVRIFREPIIFFFLTSPFIWLVPLTFAIVKRYGILSKAFGQKIISILVYIAIPSLFGFSRWRFALALYISIIFGALLFHLQHSVNLPYREKKNEWNFIKAALEGSTFLNIPTILRPFSNGIEYHHIHHLNTNVASYNIKQCHQEFEKEEKRGKKWEDYQINKVEFGTSFSSIFNVMFDEEKKMLVPFSYSQI